VKRNGRCNRFEKVCTESEATGIKDKINEKWLKNGKNCDSYTMCIAVFLLSYTFFGKNVF